jgi:hypothetical protein
MIISAALCPAPPLLARELTGADPVVPKLRQACNDATVALVADEPDLIAVVGVAADTRTWPAGGRLELSAYAPALGAGAGGGAEGCGSAGGGTEVRLAASESRLPLPLPLGLASRLLDQAGYAGRRELQAVSDLEPAATCEAIGARLAGASARVALLVMADGSARRGLKAPGYLDDRSVPFDAEVERAIRAVDMSALLALDPVLARELMATGRAAWQVLAGAMTSSRSSSEIRYCEDPFGVAYLVASLRVDG